MTYDIDFVEFQRNEAYETVIVEIREMRGEAAEVPRKGEHVLIDGTTYRVFGVAWNYEDAHVRVVLSEVVGGMQL